MVVENTAFTDVGPMEVQSPSPGTQPFLSQYQDPALFFNDRLIYLRKSRPGFSITKACRSLRRVSPALVTLMIQKKRRITPDRVDELSQLMDLSAAERAEFSRLVRSQMTPTTKADSSQKPFGDSRKTGGLHLLNDWINAFVKDAFQIKKVQDNPELMFEMLGNLASRTRLERSLRFLLAEGYLRRNLKGGIELDASLTVTQSPISSLKIRRFHQAALKNASQALEIHPIDQRFANTLVIPLNRVNYLKLVSLIEAFAEQAMDFAENNVEDPENLYQLIVNLSPASRRNP